MIARLQRLLTIGGLALVWFWVWRCLEAGHPRWAYAGMLMVLFGHSAVLALEFLLMRRASRDDPTPRATRAELLAAWLAETRAALTVFCWRQPFRSLRWPDLLPASADAAPRRGVVLVHGFMCNRGIWNRWLRRLRENKTPFVAVNLEPIFGSIEDYAGQIESAVHRVWRCSGLPPVIVAHSMGGLAVRQWLATSATAPPLHRLITIATPHHGTWLARFARSANARQMHHGSDWLSGLSAREQPDFATTGLTCFYGNCDNIVFPARLATLHGADNRHIPGVAHVEMVDHPAPWAELQRWLASET